MASALGTQHIGSRNLFTGQLLTGGATVTGTYVALKDFKYFAAFVAFVVKNTALTQVDILAATDNSGTNATVIKTTGTVNAATVNDNAFLEFDVSELNAIRTDFTHAAVKVTQNTADKSEAVIIQSGARFAFNLLTPATTIQ